MRTPDEITQDEEAKEYLRAVASIAGDFASALRDAGVPDNAAHQMLVDWHSSLLEVGIVWEAEED